MARPRIGLSTSLEHSLEETRIYVQAADAAGYEAAFIPEAWGRDALVVLTHLAGLTRQIQLGTGIVNVYSRTPAAVAMAIASLDEVSGGRAVLGLGASGQAVIEGWHGVPFDRPLARIRDYVAIVRKIFNRDRGPYEGECFKLAPGFILRSAPPRANLPIYLAALSPGAVRLAGEVADGWFPYLVPMDHLAEARKDLEQGLARAGRPREAVTVAPFIPVSVHDDLDTARLGVKRVVAFYVGGMGKYYHQTVSRYGFRAAADRIREEWQNKRREEAIAAVPDELVDAVAACGTIERCRAKLAEFRQAGADLPLVSLTPGYTAEQAAAIITALAE